MPTVKGGYASEPAGSTTNRSPSISRSVIPQVVASSRSRVWRAPSMPRSRAAAVSIRAWMRVDSQCIVAQLPPQMPSQRLRPTTRGRSQALSSSARIRPVAAAVSASMVRSALLATRREFAPSRSSSLAVNSSIASAFALQPSPQSLGEVVRV